jgi:prepilin-type N-terminal cleavage/methylation domain-containing protein
MIRRGFTLIELLVVIVIISILITLALPNYMKARDKAKEAQVKAGGHIIQIALERYAVDFNGSFPRALGGGDPYFNWFSMDLYFWNACSSNPMGLTSPLADHFHPDDPRTFQRHDGCTDREWCIGDGSVTIGSQIPGLPSLLANKRICMDPLLLFNYLAQYPVDPFVRKDKQGSFGPYTPNGGWNPIAIGGREGNLMWDHGRVHGEWPWIDFWAGVDPANHRPKFGPPNLDVPGNFYYHPLFCDGMPVATHKWALVDWNGGDGSDSAAGRMIFSHEVCGYILALTGAPDTRGIDANKCAMSDAYGWTFWDGTGFHIGPSGYFSNEPDPISSLWVGSGQTRYCTGTTSSTGFSPYAVESGDETGPAGSGPDGVPDYYIAVLFGGLDRAPRQLTGTRRE